MGVKDALAEKTGTKGEVKLTKSMSIADMIKAMKPEIEKALPKVITPERFTRMALSALNTTPKLQECSQMSFLGALMNAAQLGLEPNTPLGQAYLIPYKNHGKLECQFQIGYKGLIDMFTAMTTFRLYRPSVFMRMMCLSMNWDWSQNWYINRLLRTEGKCFWCMRFGKQRTADMVSK